MTTCFGDKRETSPEGIFSIDLIVCCCLHALTNINNKKIKYNDFFIFGVILKLKIINHFTINFPFMLLCPEPQNTEQNDVNDPSLSAVNSITVSLPTSSLSLMPYSSIFMPWGTSMLVTFSLTLSPLFTSMTSGSKANCLAVILNSLTLAPETWVSWVVGSSIVGCFCCGTGVPPPTKDRK